LNVSAVRNEQNGQIWPEIDGESAVAFEAELEQVTWSSPKRKKAGVECPCEGLGQNMFGWKRDRHVSDAVDTYRMSRRFAPGGVAMPGER
jgi:hypothetical protein